MPPRLSCLKLIVIVTVAVAFLFVLEGYISFYMSGEKRVRLYRVQFYIVLELVMLIGSRNIFQQVFKKPLLQDFTREHQDDAAAQWQKEKEYSHLLNTNPKYKIWKYSVLLFCLLAHLSYVISYIFVSDEPYHFAMLCWISFGYFLHLIATLISLSIINFLSKHIISKTGIFNQRYIFHLNNSKKKALVAIIIAFCIGTFSHITTLQNPQAKYISVPLTNLPKAFDNFVIVQLTDIHLGPTVGASKLKGAVDIVNNMQPPANLVVITGDLVDSSVRNLQGAARPLKELNPSVPKLFVTGNHEYYTGDVENWFIHLKSLGIDPLHNTHKKLYSPISRNDYLCIAGTDDIQALKSNYEGHGMDLQKALQGCSDTMPIILLAHQPNAAKQALEQYPNINLILSGHTHGGQFYPTALGAYLLNAFYAGLYKYAPNAYVYVSKGTFYYGAPMKMANTMEISHITLKITTLSSY